MSESAPAFQLYVRDWLISTASMTDEQSGAYMRLLCHAWDAEGLPADEATIQAIGRWTDEQWSRIWPAVGPKWQRRGAKLVNRRQELEREGLKRYREASSRGGKRSAQVRAVQRVSQGDLKHPSKTLAAPLQVNGNTSSSSSIQEQTTTTDQIARESAPPSSPVVCPPDFDPTAYSRGQIRAGMQGLIGAWNNVAISCPQVPAVDPAFSTPSLSRALARHPQIDWWGDVFRKVAASDYLTGRDGKHPPMQLVRVVDIAEDIAAGKYDNRPAAKVAKPAERQGVGQPRYRTIADEIGTPEYQKFLELSKNDYKREAH